MVAKLLKTSMESRPLSTNCLLYGSLAGLAEFSQQALTATVKLADEKVIVRAEHSIDTWQLMTRSISMFCGICGICFLAFVMVRRHLVIIIFKYFVSFRRTWNITPRLWATTQSSEEESSLPSFTSGTNGLIESSQVNILTSDELVLFNGFFCRNHRQDHPQESGAGYLGVCRALLHCILCEPQPPLWCSTPGIFIWTKTEITSNNFHNYSVLAACSDVEFSVRHFSFNLENYILFVLDSSLQNTESCIWQDAPSLSLIYWHFLRN